MGFWRYLIVAAGSVGCLCLSAGCGNSGSQKTPLSNEAGPSSDQRAEPAPAVAQSKKGETPTDPTGSSDGMAIEGPFGAIEGRVKFVGDEIPTSTIVSNTTDPLICGSEISKRDLEISSENKGIRNVLIWLEDVKLPDGYKPPRQDLVVDNKNCQFEPHAAAITVGSTIEATNSDDVFHTTNLYGAASENMPLVSKGASQKTVARRVGIIPVKCDKHGWMQAFIRVDPHPFHAVTDSNGEFSIANVPVGTYKLKAWHEVFYGQDLEVSVREDEKATLEIQYPKAD